MEVFILFNVYVPVNAGENKFCWDSLRDLVDEGVLENIIIARDLNISLSQSENLGGSELRVGGGSHPRLGFARRQAFSR